MKKSFLAAALGTAALCFSSLFLLAWQQPNSPAKPVFEDTIPAVRELNMQDLDKAMEELDRGMKQLEKELKEKNWDQMNLAMKESLKAVDAEKIKAEVEKALKEVDAAKIKAELDASLAKVDMEAIKKEIEKIKEVNLAEVEKQMKDLKPELEKSLKAAKADIEKAKKEIAEYKNFLTSLEKDGLINKKENYTIEHKDGVLLINGVAQPEAVYKKYQEFLKKHKQFSFKNQNDQVELNKD